jgi:hypothetical protein
MQQIANLLIFQSAQPRTLGELSKPIAADANHRQQKPDCYILPGRM